MGKRVVLLGGGELAVRIGNWLLQRDDFDLVCVVPVVPEEAGSASLIHWSRARNVRFIDSGESRDVVATCGENWRADIALSVGYPSTLDTRFVDRVTRCLNVHNGPLPRYRGDSPINWALKNGERSHGVTLHEVTPRRHAGPIVGQVIFPIHPECDEVIDVVTRAAEYGYTLLTQTLPVLHRVEPIAQDETQASGYGEEDRTGLGDRRGSTRRRSNPVRPNGSVLPGSQLTPASAAGPR